MVGAVYDFSPKKMAIFLSDWNYANFGVSEVFHEEVFTERCITVSKGQLLPLYSGSQLLCNLH